MCRVPGDVLVVPLHAQKTVAHQLLFDRVEVDDGHELEGDGDDGGGGEVLHGSHRGVQRQSVFENLVEVFA